MPTIYIDDKPFEVPQGDNVLQACLSAGIDLPYFCWHPEMGSVGACRQCALVQYRDADDEHGRIVMGCMTPVADGARFSLKGGAAGEFRKNVIESLMLNHPHDCPVWGEGGECHLQDMTVMTGHRNRRYRGKKNTHRNQDLGPLINHEMNRCISCYRCTRFYNDYAGGTDLSAQGAHDHVYFGRQEDGTLESEFAGNLVEVCPTGVFTDKPLVNDYTRKWDLQSAPSVCTACALGCNTLPGERYGKLKRIHNRFNNDVNGYFLCDRGRYGGNYVNNEERVGFAGLRRSGGDYDAIETQQTISRVAEWCNTSTSGKRIAAIGSPRASLESNFLLREFVGKENFCVGMSDSEAESTQEIISILKNGSVVSPSMRQIEAADAVLILGEDVTNTAPRLALSLRQSVRNRAKQMATDMRIPLWQDEAVRVLAQDQLSPLFMVGVAATRLDDIAEQTLCMSPPDIARFGYAIAAELDDSLASVSGFDADSQATIKLIAAALKLAKRPLIVSGTGVQDISVIKAAAAVAHAVKNSECMLSYCLPESNSLGVALLEGGAGPSLHELVQSAASGELETLIVLENDLYRRAAETQISALLDTASQVVVLDAIDTPTMSKSTLALPSASFAECEGTLVSSEGRSQRHYPVFLPVDQRQPAWQWLKQIGQQAGSEGFDQYSHFDSVTAACSQTVEALNGIVEASPSAEFRTRGLKIPRQPQRYSGRTAMRSNISVHEPKQPQDDDSPFSFSMEGATGSQPGALIPFVWSPGWNSNQSLHKFQSKAGGALRGGTAGVRLIEPSNDSVPILAGSLPDPLHLAEGQLRLVPIYRIFGSEELSAHSPAIQELTDKPFILISPDGARSLELQAGDLAEVSIEGEDFALEIKLDASIAAGCAGYSVGLPGAKWLPPGINSSLRPLKPFAKDNTGGVGD